MAADACGGKKGEERGEERAAYPGWLFRLPINGGYAMYEGTVEAIRFPAESSKDVLTEILREGAQKMLATAIRTSEPFRRGSAR